MAATGASLLLAGLAMRPCAATRADETAAAAARKLAKLKPGDTVRLFRGQDLTGWRVVEANDFKRHGKVSVQEGALVLEAGRPATGVAWKGPFPRSQYEVRLEARRIEGSDFFCGLTFPVGDGYCTLILGGWGGGVTGLSNIDDESAVDNETTGYTDFQRNRWYAVRLQVTDGHVRAWIGEEQIVDVERRDRKFSVWWEQEPVRPFGVSCWYTKAALRKVTVRGL